MSNILVINASGPETRVALVENGTISEFYLERKKEKGIVGNIYKGKVVRVLPGMQAAFVDIGLEKAAFLYVADVAGGPDFSEEFDLAETPEGEHGEPPLEEVPAEDDGDVSPADVRHAVPTAPLEERAAELEQAPAIVTQEDSASAIATSGSEASKSESSESKAAEPVDSSAATESADAAADSAPVSETSTPIAVEEPAASTAAAPVETSTSKPSESATGDAVSDEVPSEVSSGAAPVSDVAVDSVPSDAAEVVQPAEPAAEAKTEVSVGAASAEGALEDTDAEESETSTEEATDEEDDEDDVASSESDADVDAESDSESEIDPEAGTEAAESEAPATKSGRRRGKKDKSKDKDSRETGAVRAPRVEPLAKKRRRNGATPDPHPVADTQKGKAQIQDLLKEGQEVIVQVVKDPIGTKGARVTCHISLPGRHLVFMPTVDHVGISRRIEAEKERRRLRELVDALRPAGTGFIVRTVADGVERGKLEADIRFLLGLWNDMARRKDQLRAPALLHPDLDLILRSIRDLFSAEVEKLVIDDRDEYERIVQFVEKNVPQLRDAIQPYEGAEPIFDAYGIEQELTRAMSRKVWLKSGGYLIIDQAEALVAIDINSGRFVGKKNLEETITQINVEAAKEIVYQLRLRNVGGIIIIDFIDMEKQGNRDKVLKALQDALQRDRAKTNIVKISELGLVEMTRKRVRESVNRLLQEPCSYCDGRGSLKSKATVAYEIFREIHRESMSRREDTVVVSCHPDVARFITQDERESLRHLMMRFNKTVQVKPQGGYHQEQYELSARWSKRDEQADAARKTEGAKKVEGTKQAEGAKQAAGNRQAAAKQSGGAKQGGTAKQQQRTAKASSTQPAAPPSVASETPAATSPEAAVSAPAPATEEAGESSSTSSRRRRRRRRRPGNGGAAPDSGGNANASAGNGDSSGGGGASNGLE